MALVCSLMVVDSDVYRNKLILESLWSITLLAYNAQFMAILPVRC